MKKQLITSVLMVIVTTVWLGIVYPLVVTGIAQVVLKDKANGQLIARNGIIVASRIIGQPFTGRGYFHSRPSAAGTAGYDAGNSSGSNLGPTKQKLIDRVKGDRARVQAENLGTPVPVDLVTTYLRPLRRFRFRAWLRNAACLRIRCGVWCRSTQTHANSAFWESPA